MTRNNPLTRDEARRRRYGAWAGNPQGFTYDEKECAFEVIDRDRGARAHQCSRSPGFGPDKLYCANHAREFERNEIVKWWTKGKWHEAEIKRVIVDSETEKFVMLKGRREAKDSEWGIYHDTWAVARDYLLERGGARLTAAKRELEEAEKFVTALRAMKEPT